jgi:hypoxanthine phosphoribosyltransferase
MRNDVQEILITENEIRERIQELGRNLSEFYRGKELLLVCILKGGVMFLADLARALSIPCELDFMAVSSYGAATETSGVVRILKDLDKSIQGKHVLLVEDVVDTGLTLQYLVNNLKDRNPASLRICSLLNKEANRKVDVEVDFVGFEIPDKFVVGFGLDFDGGYRHLPYVAVLKPEIYSEGANR